MWSVIFFVAIIAACLAMLWVAFKMEPHWVNKDGSRFVCYGQALTAHGQPIGRWRELRMATAAGDTLEVRPRRGSLTVDADSMPSASKVFTRKMTKLSYWKVVGRSQADPGRKTIYMLSTNMPDMPPMLAIRVPSRSRAIETLESLAQNKAKVTPSTPSPETPRSAAQPDRD